MKKIRGFLVYFVILFFLTGCHHPESLEAIHQYYSQDAAHYLHEDFHLSSDAQKKLAADYLTHFFSPWGKKHLLLSVEKVKQSNIDVIASFKSIPFFMPTLHQYSADWFNQLEQNMELDHFPNLEKPGIMINDTEARLLPTFHPAFKSLTDLGASFSFDQIQQSHLSANTPVYILQVSHDKEWYCVLTPSYIAWVNQKDIAFVNSTFIKKWKRQHFITPLFDDISILDKQNYFLGKTTIGLIYPLVKTTANSHQILFAVRNKDRQASLQQGFLPREKAAVFPLRLSDENIALLANKMMGQPYSWGGQHGFRDCSALMMDLFSPFGIWLPRNSLDQVHDENFVPLTQSTETAKEDFILHHAIPFVTIIHKPGHIVLYLGEFDHQVYIYQNTWKAKQNKSLFSPDTFTNIGAVVITPINFRSFLTKADGMRVLVDKADLLPG